MKTFIILLLSIILFSCEKEVEENIYYYDITNNSNATLIISDTLDLKVNQKSNKYFQENDSIIISFCLFNVKNRIYFKSYTLIENQLNNLIIKDDFIK